LLGLDGVTDGAQVSAESAATSAGASPAVTSEGCVGSVGGSSPERGGVVTSDDGGPSEGGGAAGGASPGATGGVVSGGDAVGGVDGGDAGGGALVGGDTGGAEVSGGDEGGGAVVGGAAGKGAAVVGGEAGGAEVSGGAVLGGGAGGGPTSARNDAATRATAELSMGTPVEHALWPCADHPRWDEWGYGTPDGACDGRQAWRRSRRGLGGWTAEHGREHQQLALRDLVAGVELEHGLVARAGAGEVALGERVAGLHDAQEHAQAR
jgi:hypothetical protein